LSFSLEEGKFIVEDGSSWGKIKFERGREDLLSYFII